MAKTAQTQNPFAMFTSNGVMNNDAMRENMDRFVSMAGNMTELSREGFQACAEAARVTAKGAQEANSKTIAYMQSAMSESMEATKTVAGAKSMQEAVEVQANFAKSALDAYMTQMSSIASLMADTMREATQPLNAHAGQMVEKLQAVK